MKKINLILLCCLVINSLLAQSNIAIQLDGIGSNIAGTTHNVNLTLSSSELSDLGNGTGLYEVHFEVSNFTGTNTQWKITRKNLNVPSTWSDQLCWPPLCYNANGEIFSTPNSGSNPAPILINGKVFSLGGTHGSINVHINGNIYPIIFDTDLNSTASNFILNYSSQIFTTDGLTVINNGNELIFSDASITDVIEFESLENTANCLVGKIPYELKPRITIDLNAATTGHYRYYINDVATGDYLDSIDLEVNFVLAVAPIKQNATISLSPNPASENVAVSLGSADNGTVRIVDVLGNVVYNETIYSGSKNIDVSNFKNGVYFVIIDPADAKPVNRKLIVRH